MSAANSVHGTPRSNFAQISDATRELIMQIRVGGLVEVHRALDAVIRSESNYSTAEVTAITRAAMARIWDLKRTLDLLEATVGPSLLANIFQRPGHHS